MWIENMDINKEGKEKSWKIWKLDIARIEKVKGTDQKKLFKKNKSHFLRKTAKMIKNDGRHDTN